jgi:hypothetical protein
MLLSQICTHCSNTCQYAYLVYAECGCSLCTKKQLAPDTAPGTCAAAVMLPHVLQQGVDMHALHEACCCSLFGKRTRSSAWLRDCRCIPVLALVAAGICCCCVQCGEGLLLRHISGSESCKNSAASVTACRLSFIDKQQQLQPSRTTRMHDVAYVQARCLNGRRTSN